jgi:hypothetical protein
MVTLRSLKFHTHNGEEHPEGSLYEVAEDQVDNLTGQRMAERAEPDAPAPSKPSQPVEPMTLANFAQPTKPAE